MPVGMFKLSHKQRQNLSSVFIILNIVQIILGTGMTSSSIYIFVAVSPVFFTERAEVNFVFAVTGLYGTNVIFHWIIGIRMCWKCFHQAHKKSTSSLLLLWYCAGTNTVVILIIISHYARKSGKHIIKSMKQSISSGMAEYLIDISWKETIDKLQYSNECCGMTSYDDWHTNNWLTKYHVDVNSETVKQFRTSEEALDLPVTPWSCCRVDFPMQCLHDPLQQAQYAHIWVDEPTVVKDSMNTKGCLDILKRPILTVINLFVCFTSMVFVIHIIIFIISRILYTSSRNALLLNDPEGIAPGWVFGRGDCGYSGGKPLGEIMEKEMPQKKDSRDEEVKKKTKKKFGECLPQRFRRNKKSSKLDEFDESMAMLERGYPEFSPTHHSTAIRKEHHTKNETEMEDSGEALSMERELNALNNLVSKREDTENDKHAESMEGELRRLQQ